MHLTSALHLKPEDLSATHLAGASHYAAGEIHQFIQAGQVYRVYTAGYAVSEMSSKSTPLL